MYHLNLIAINQVFNPVQTDPYDVKQKAVTFHLSNLSSYSFLQYIAVHIKYRKVKKKKRKPQLPSVYDNIASVQLLPLFPTLSITAQLLTLFSTTGCVLCYIL